MLTRPGISAMLCICSSEYLSFNLETLSLNVMGVYELGTLLCGAGDDLAWSASTFWSTSSKAQEVHGQAPLDFGRLMGVNIVGDGGGVPIQ